MTEHDQAEFRRMTELLDSLTCARDRAERERDALRDALRTIPDERRSTPSTDAEVVRLNYGHDMVFGNFARRLERERDELRALNLLLTRDLNDSLRKITALEATLDE